MKKLFMMVAIAILTISAAFGQENGNRSEDNKVVRGPYLTNSAFFDNMFIGVGGGVNAFATKNLNFFPLDLGINAEGFIGKWFTPTVGARVGYKGLTNNADGVGYWQHYVHGDVMWNLSDALGGYKETRVWDFVPYMTAGAYDLIDATVGGHNLEYGAGAGLYNKIRLSDRVSLYLDLSTLVVRANAYLPTPNRFGFVPSASFGVVLNIGKNTGFKRYSTAVASYYSFNESDYANALALNKKYEGEIDSLKCENKCLASAVDSLNNIKPEIKEVVKEVAVNEVAVYFEKGQYVINEKELSHVMDYAKSVSNDIKVTIIGSADSMEGSVERNKFLSEQRANVVMNLLVEKFGFKKENITIETTMDVADTPERSRVAIVK